MRAPRIRYSSETPMLRKYRTLYSIFENLSDFFNSPPATKGMLAHLLLSRKEHVEASELLLCPQNWRSPRSFHLQGGTKTVKPPQETHP